MQGILFPFLHIPNYITQLLMFVQCDIVLAKGAEVPLGKNVLSGSIRIQGIVKAYLFQMLLIIMFDQE